MDIRNGKWFGQLTITGVGTPINRDGTIMGITSEFFKDLMQLNPRALAAGNKEVVMRFSDKPFGTDKIQDSVLDKATEVAAGLDVNESEIEQGKPRSGETFEQYYDRLVAEGSSPATASFFACDWFDREQDPELLNWLADPKAIRFRQLNSINEEYAKATPEEYMILKHHVIQHYPNMTASLTFRVA